MSGGYYNQQGYGSHHHDSSDQPQYLHQNYGYQNQGFVPAYPSNPAFAPVSEEYLRQPPSAPTMPMPQPAPPVMRMTEPPAPPVMRMTEPPEQQPRVIIVHPQQRDEDCCRSMCRCIDWLLTRILHVLLTLFLLGLLLGLGIWLIHKYRKH